MKKVFLGLLVAGVALSASAFKNVESAKRFAQTYFHTSTGYVLAADLPAGTECEPVSQLPCSIVIQDADIPANYPILDSQLSTVPYTQVGTNKGLYQ
ncbi:hypothetical protein [Pedobacter sp. MC2016-24]|uniref:hypothetical protein n=1 Tax=Pedobacter sp. MC2016-24 TaxID=2780090 RepID=UPI00187E6B68|nr:hypothetical protein [Pedobacter sp. MC2016-24]MBE9600170.1 hypothetical protein [Pedobacter sp. MC2016-24]